MRVVIAASIVILGSTNRAQSQYKSIDELKVDKVGLDTPLKDFLKMHPKAELEKSTNDKHGIKTYILVDEDEECYSFFSFLDEKPYRIGIRWTQKGLDNSGGWEPIVGKIVAKYGKADANSPGLEGKNRVYWWSTPDSFLVISVKDGLGIGLTSNAVSKQLNELKARKAKSKIDD